MKTVIEMAREVYGKHTEWTHSQHERLKQLEALIRADEREACAKVCETEWSTLGQMEASSVFAAAIRNRSKT